MTAGHRVAKGAVVKESVKRAVRLTVDLEALQHNFRQVKKQAPESNVMPVIKANAYGHGMLKVAEALHEADGFAVAQLSEAKYLREAGINKPITVFQGFSNKVELQQFSLFNLRPAICQLWQIDLLESMPLETKLEVWLKINTGMGRLGLQVADVEVCWQRLSKLGYIHQTGLMMHFANSDEPAHPSNQVQIDCFKTLSDKLAVQTSISNSGAIIAQLYKQQDWVRPGIMLYGSSPLLNQSAEQLSLKPVMTLEAQLIAVNRLNKGQSVGYGDGWICPEDMPVGIVNIGYGDGYPRHAPTGTPVLVNGQITQLIGRVSMDSIAVDLRGINTNCGDTVELWGKQISVDTVAAQAGTIAYELLCNVGRC